MAEDEDDQTFLLRRAAEERGQAAASSCMVRSVHEEMVEIYEERLEAAAGRTAALEALLARIDAA